MNPIREIAIVGGGTAGWMAAVFLATDLNRRAKGGSVRITLIESPNVPTVGVGEATVPGMPHWLRSMGISETAFFHRCNASFKLGVIFRGWNNDPDSGQPLDFTHPFDVMEDTIHGFSPAYHFQRFGGPGGENDFSGFVSPAGAMIDGLRAPKRAGSKDFDGMTRYAYHLDAGLFAGLLQEVATGRGVNHLRDDVVDVELDERGFVAALQLAGRGRHAVDFVIDCTGFAGIVLQKTLGVEWQNWNEFLMNDRALAVRIPHAEPERLLPATTSTALGAGWAWRVPLWSRIGTGYVFSSAHRTDDEALEELLAHLGPQAEGCEPRAIGIRVGRTRKSWHRNCVAIGLSGGFIEPLESTAIYLIDMALKWLVNYFPDRDFDPVLENRYNTMMDRLYTEIRDFIVLHYCTSNREDTDYWRAAQHEMKVPDTVREQIAVLSRAFPNSDDFERGLLFSYVSYIIVLLGKRRLDGIEYPAARSIDPGDWVSWVRHMEGVGKRFLAELPDHRTLLGQIRGRYDENAPVAAGLSAREASPPVRPVIGGRLDPVITVRPGVGLGAGNLL